ncbi:MAG: hypothetical protein KAI18_04700, partial [Candidatus Aenigmarchaeota archaeon]|nr:hypothetical protein [Candidatus Aenigmarchaeota archaeon]
LEKNQLFHELRGAEYIEIHGLEKGVADSIEDLYRIAQMIRPHYVVSEQVGDPENREPLDEFGLLDSDLLIPRTWQESIIIYAELSNVDGRKVSIKERVDDVKDRYTNDPRYNTNTSLVKAMETGLDRVLNVCDRVQNLIDGKYELEEIMKYGFI